MPYCSLHDGIRAEVSACAAAGCFGPAAAGAVRRCLAGSRRRRRRRRRPREAAARELREETGLAVTSAELYPVAYTTGCADLGWASGLFRDDFFLHRVTSHQVDIAGLTEFERRHYRGHRWWTQAELATTRETVYPFNLAALIAGLIAGRLPATPIALPWHH
jgi:8-oxo-dGTP pyrophosphatase MutT (NUDIX family)